MYDENLNIVSDWKFIIECMITHNCDYRHWKRIVVNYPCDGMSSKPENCQNGDTERKIYKNNTFYRET